MKRFPIIIFWLIVLTAWGAGHGPPVTLMVYTNGQLAAPTNFWAANQSNITSVLTNVGSGNVYSPTNISTNSSTGTAPIVGVQLASASLMPVPGEAFTVYGSGLEASDLAIAIDSQTNGSWDVLVTGLLQNTNWVNPGASWTSNANTFTHVAGNVTTLSNVLKTPLWSLFFSPNVYYNWGFTIAGRSSGYIAAKLGGTTTGWVQHLCTNDGAYSFEMDQITTFSNGIFRITPSSTFNGTISSVWITLVTNTWNATNSLTLWLLGTNLPASPPATAVDCTILNRGTNGATALPVYPFANIGYSDVFRAVWAYSSAGGWSAPIHVNQPEIWGAYPERPAPGDYVKIWGVNFGRRGGGQNLYGYTALVDAVNAITFVPWFQDVYDDAPSQEFTLCNFERVIQIPTNTTPGAYRLFLNAGIREAPSDWAWSAGFPITVWTNEITRPAFFCYPPEGTNDALADIQFAINNCDTNGGGVVHLPAGTFTVSSNITWEMCSNRVVLKGAGKNSTILKGAANISKSSLLGYYNQAPVVYMTALANGGGLEDLSVVCPSHVTSNWNTLSVYVFYSHSGFSATNVLHNMSFKNCLFRRDGMSPSLASTGASGDALMYLWGTFRNLEVTDCDFVNGRISANSGTFYNTRFERNKCPTFDPNASYGGIYRDNKMNGLIITYGTHNYVQRNSFEGRKWLAGSSETLLYHSTPDYTFMCAPISTTTNSVTIKSWSATPTVAEAIVESDWGGANWSGNNTNGFVHTPGVTTALTNSVAASVYYNYMVLFSVSNRTAGTVAITLGSSNYPGTFAGTVNGTDYSICISWPNGTLAITPSADFNGTVYGVSIKPVMFWLDYAYGYERDACVTVIKGKGYGQVRRIIGHTLDPMTATLERNWTVEPDTTSLLVFSYGWNMNVQVQNKFINCVHNGAQIYGSGIRNMLCNDEYMLCQGATAMYQIYTYPMSFNTIRDTRSFLSGAVSLHCGSTTNYMTNVAFMIGNEFRKNASYSTTRLPDNWYGVGADEWNAAYGLETGTEGTPYTPPIGKEPAVFVSASVSSLNCNDDDAGYDSVPVKPIAWTLVSQCFSANAPRALRITRAANYTTVYNIVSSASNDQISDSGSHTVINSPEVRRVRPRPFEIRQ